MNSTYFSRINQTLKDYKRAIPCLFIDLDILDKSLSTLAASLREGVDFRVVVKSLPSLELVQYVMDKENN